MSSSLPPEGPPPGAVPPPPPTGTAEYLESGSGRAITPGSGIGGVRKGLFVAGVEMLGRRLAGRRLPIGLAVRLAGCLVTHLVPPLVLVLLASIRRECYPVGSVLDLRRVNVTRTATLPSTAPPGKATYAASGPARRSPSIFSKSAV